MSDFEHTISHNLGKPMARRRVGIALKHYSDRYKLALVPVWGGDTARGTLTISGKTYPGAATVTETSVVLRVKGLAWFYQPLAKIAIDSESGKWTTP